MTTEERDALQKKIDRDLESQDRAVRSFVILYPLGFALLFWYLTAYHSPTYPTTKPAIHEQTQR